MKRILVSRHEDGQRLDKLLHKMLREAPDSFLYKMLRKKNITLNGRKADGSEKVSCGDRLEFFLSDETFEKFAPGLAGRLENPARDGQMRGSDNPAQDGQACGSENPAPGRQACGPARQEASGLAASAGEASVWRAAYHKIGRLEILYEDDHVLLVNKPAGLLTQKAKAEDLSLNEWLTGYLLAENKLGPLELRTFRPSVCNRLDRNTSGLVICGISLAGSRKMSELLKERTLSKYYRLLVKGRVEQESRLEGYLQKDAAQNRVQVLTQGEYERLPEREQKRYAGIRTGLRPINTNGRVTLLEAELITGKTHQIRAHLASIGHPLIGDPKYGDAGLNQSYRRCFGVRFQLLHAYRLEFPQMEAPFEALSSRSVLCEMPELYETILRGGQISVDMEFQRTQGLYPGGAYQPHQ